MQAFDDFSGGSYGSDSEWDEEEEHEEEEEVDELQVELKHAAAAGDLAAVERALAAGADADKVRWGQRARASAAPITRRGALLSSRTFSSRLHWKDTSQLSPG